MGGEWAFRLGTTETREYYYCRECHCTLRLYQLSTRIRGNGDDCVWGEWGTRPRRDYTTIPSVAQFNDWTRFVSIRIHCYRTRNHIYQLSIKSPTGKTSISKTLIHLNLFADQRFLIGVPRTPRFPLNDFLWDSRKNKSYELTQLKKKKISIVWVLLIALFFMRSPWLLSCQKGYVCLIYIVINEILLISIKVPI